MADSIGGVTFPYPLKVKTYLPAVAGSVVRCVTGEILIIQTNPSTQDTKIVVVYDWTPLDLIEILKNLWRNGGVVSYSIAGVGSGQAIFDPSEGMDEPTHQAWGIDAGREEVRGTATDLFTGTLTLWKVTT